jgi:predicted nucleic acid-binding protein
MSAYPTACVLDASVVIKLLLIEDHTADVQAYFLQAGAGVELHAPDLLLIECTNILWKQVQRSGYAVAQARRDLADLLSLPAIQFVPTSTLLPPALDLAALHAISTYDACYVALADRLQLPLLTADRRLATKLADSPHLILTLDALKGH